MPEVITGSSLHSADEFTRSQGSGLHSRPWGLSLPRLFFLRTTPPPLHIVPVGLCTIRLSTKVPKEVQKGSTLLMRTAAYWASTASGGSSKCILETAKKAGAHKGKSHRLDQKKMCLLATYHGVMANSKRTGRVRAGGRCGIHIRSQVQIHITEIFSHMLTGPAERKLHSPPLT